MKRPVEISVGRLTLPSGFQGREQAFTQALGRAVDQRVAGGAPDKVAQDKVARAADRAATAVVAQTKGRWSDG
jgi:hypothetical protein